MAQLASTDTVAVQLEMVDNELPLLVEKETVLDSRIQDAGKSERVSTRNYRIPMQVALPGAVAKVNLDGGDFPRGGKSKYDVGQVTPLAYCVPLEFTKLADLTGSGGNVSTIDVISRNIADCMAALRLNRDKFLQTDGTGKLATVTSVAGLVITLNATPFGARLLAVGQKVQVFNGTTLRGSCTITDISQGLGNTQTITVDAVPGGTIGNDFLRVDGAENGAPIFLNGIPVFHSTATTGSVLGISRTNSYVVANGVNAASASITQPMVRLMKNQIRQRLGEAALKGIEMHTHPSQLSSWEDIGYQMQTAPLNNGKAGDFDPMYQGKKTMDGHNVIENIHADQTRIDALNLKFWGKVKWGKGPFWYEVEGQRMWPIPAAAGGGWSSGVICFLVDCIQYYVNNMAALSSITSLTVPQGN